MTEKRFTLGYEDDFLRWIRDNPNRKNYVVRIGFGEKDNLQDVCDLLNQLSEENEQLKSELSEKDIQLDFLKAENNHMSELVNENKQLKKRLIKLKVENVELKEENEKLWCDGE